MVEGSNFKLHSPHHRTKQRFSRLQRTFPSLLMGPTNGKILQVSWYTHSLLAPSLPEPQILYFIFVQSGFESLAGVALKKAYSPPLLLHFCPIANIQDVAAFPWKSQSLVSSLKSFSSTWREKNRYPASLAITCCGANQPFCKPKTRLYNKTFQISWLGLLELE